MDMNHLIGQRFNLISKSDIRYVGTLHEINPEASTIALENVMSHGTEGRRGDGTDVPPSNSVYEYIVFRGSDVKDISVADEEKKENTQPEPPRVPDDPAILGNMPRPGPPPGQEPGPAPGLQGPPQPHSQQGPPGYPQQPPFQSGPYPPYGQRFGPPPPFPPGPGFPPYGAPPGAPPGWFPPPGHGFPQGPGQFPPNMPMGPHGQQLPPQQRPGPPGVPPHPTSELPVGDKVPSKPATPAAQNAPTPPIESKPSVAEAVQGLGGPTAIPQKSGRVVPAIPIAAPKSAAPAGGAHGNASITDATAAATAAVAAAMAKLPQPGVLNKPGQGDVNVDGLARRMNDMRPYDGTRAPRGGHQHPRGGRGGVRNQQHKKIEVPTSDYDFETANAKFNKQDLVKEAIATGSPAAEAESQASAELEVLEVPPNGTTSGNGPYNRTASFFDNISSEARDREDNSLTRPGGREWRGEEEKRNIETFGQGSVDGYRGRGRGRGLNLPQSSVLS
ncbi:Lsm14 N-terminal [Penicillium angulare]|uniref:Lsm14 N-terminal n=1 Tax=Penicillium angulare TaxID=116970 RepID=UPI002541C34F|nr:Lsm14 N-terminal [Penicillium angulare]KAJ5291300.1 Lsm14 N-terminal [Penicillium angulare]